MKTMRKLGCCRSRCGKKILMEVAVESINRGHSHRQRFDAFRGAVFPGNVIGHCVEVGMSLALPSSFQSDGLELMGNRPPKR